MESAGPRLRLSVDVRPSVHYVHAHLALPIIQTVVVCNEGDSPLGPAQVEIEFSPPCAEPMRLGIDTIRPGGSCTWQSPMLRLDRELLASASESLDVIARCVVRPLAAGGGAADVPAPLAEAQVALRLLAFAEWPGTGELPELLAAYVTPNQPAVGALLHDASDQLRAQGGTGAIDGYQSGDARHVLRIASAIFHAVKARDIRYISPPASYEDAGQKVRFAEQVWLGRQGACLDLTLLFASALEAAGLHPVLCVEKGHAFVGCWLQGDRLFDLAFEDDVQALRKCVDGLSLSVWETTLATQPGATFAVAEAAARGRLNDDRAFRWALDVARARSRRIRPLPLANDNGRLFLAPEPEPATAPDATTTSVDARFAVLDRDRASPAAPVESPEKRVERWKRQLLDLSLRNRLLNIAERSVVRLNVASLAELENHLTEARELALLPKADPDARDPAQHRVEAQEELHAAQCRADLADGKLRTPDARTDLEAKLVRLDREARVAVDESGNNPLHVALGMLVWKEGTGAAAKTRRAPLLLLPVALERKSVRGGFRLRRREEEAVANVTLLEKLRHDWGIAVAGVDPPPQDANGIDVELVLRRFADAVADARGVEVVHEAVLGVFSFTKFLLWRDLQSRVEQLKRNAVVAHLIGGDGRPFPGSGSPIRPHETDDAVPPREVLTVLEADSSQLAAVVNAGRGQHFVLNGPPGSGKSQTIANMIAHCMALGRSVLFVAEKRTALEVVQRRLDKVGLGAFCLELHSNKTGKTTFIAQLRDAVKFGDQASPAEWESIADRLRDQRAQLNAYVRALHRRCSNGLSAFDCFGVLIPAGGQASPPPELALGDPTAQSFEDRERLRELVQVVAARLQHFPVPASHPLRWLGPAVYSRAWEADLQERVHGLTRRVGVVRDVLDDACRTLRIGVPVATRAQLQAVAALARLINHVPPVTPAFLRCGDAVAVVAAVRDALRRAAERGAAAAALDGFDLVRVAAFDLPEFERLWSANELRFAPLRWWGRRNLLAAVSALRRLPGRLEPADVPGLVERVRVFQHAEARCREVASAQRELLGGLWAEGAPDAAAVEPALGWLEASRAALRTLAGGDDARLRGLVAAWAAVAEETGGGRGTDPEAAHRLTACAEAVELFLVELHAVEERAACAATGLPSDPVEAARILTTDLLGHRADWQRWTLLQQGARRLRDAGGGSFVDAWFSGRFAGAEAAAEFDRAYAWATLQVLVDREPALLNFFGDDHEQAILRFRKLDQRLTELNRQYVVARVAAARPAGLQDDRVLGEVAKLRAEIEKKSRWKSVRGLLASIPHVLPRIKPCVLMSPLSVAQYLDAAHPPFDIVIFDEASQIPVCDAIGALARGVQTVVAGDPRQLPPTSFFQKVDVDEGDEDDPAAAPPDQESILDQCLSAQVPEHHLAWHYRSQRETLIAFSNQNYYENRLLTFPAPEAREQGVFFHPIREGFYDRGGTRTQRAEAQAVVKAVREHVMDPRKVGVSLAVITFNIEQMNLIENLLDEERRADTAFDDAMNVRTAAALEEPFKVRNLESIQGDERDVIFFSVTYGPDQAGYVSHNFGPLNKAGGERRLNVAITRAKHAVHVFSSLRSHQIDLKRASTRGVQDFRNYLQYAEEGVAALARAATRPPTDDDYDSIFEQHVAEALRRLGWEVHTQIGCSAYRIDLGVLHPTRPGRYLAGVECDGATYHRAATARDRDRLRQHFLEGLGWHILRTWSTDWFRDPAREATRLHEVLTRLMEETTNATPAVEPPLEPSAPGREVIASGPSAVAEPQMPYTTPADTDRSVPEDGVQDYVVADLPPARSDREAFFESRSRPEIAAQIRSVVEVEAPVAEDVLVTRIRAAWGFGRSGGRIVETILQAVPREVRRRGGFLWRADQDPACHAVFRRPGTCEGSRRELGDIAPEEQAAAMTWLVSRYARLEEGELLRGTAEIFGRKSLTQAARSQLQPGLMLLLDRGYRRDDHGSIVGPSSAP